MAGEAGSVAALDPLFPAPSSPACPHHPVPLVDRRSWSEFVVWGYGPTAGSGCYCCGLGTGVVVEASEEGMEQLLGTQLGDGGTVVGPVAGRRGPSDCRWAGCCGSAHVGDRMSRTKRTKGTCFRWTCRCTW